MEEINKLITTSFLKNEGETQRFLSNSENSLNNFYSDLKQIRTFQVLLETKPATEKTKEKKYYLKTDDNVTKSRSGNYNEALVNLEALEETLSFDLKLISVEDGEPEEVILTQPVNIKIPVYVGKNGNHGNVNGFPNGLETGGFFIKGNVIMLNMVFKEEKITLFPKISTGKSSKKSIKGMKDIKNFSVDSNPIRSNNDLSRPQYFKVEVDTTCENSSINISSYTSLPTVNILILIIYLTKLDLDTIKKKICFMFENERNILNQINIITREVELILKDYNNDQEIDPASKLDLLAKKYLDSKFEQFYKDYMKNVGNPVSFEDIDKYNLEKEIAFNRYFILDLYPTINSAKDIIGINSLNTITYMKGRTFLNLVGSILVGYFQEDVYINKYNPVNRRISSAGESLKTILQESLKSTISYYKDKLKKNLQTSSKSNTITIPPFTKLQNIYTNLLSMQESESLLVKPRKMTNAAQDFVTNNLVVFDSNVKLTKNLEMRHADFLKHGYEGVVDGPDHSDKVGIHKRLNISVIINDKSMDKQKTLIKEVYYFIQSYLEKHSKLNGKTEKDSVDIVLTDDSPFYIGEIEQSKVMDLYKVLVNNKRRLLFNKDPYIGISLDRLYYKEMSLKKNLVKNVYKTLRIDLGNKIMFTPHYVVENGVLNLSKLSLSDLTSENLNFDRFSRENPDIVEFLSPIELSFNNVCANIQVFMNSPEEIRKEYQYVGFDDYTKLSVLESMIFDLSKMPGTRGVFSCSQLKNSITSIFPSSNNLLTACKFSPVNIQESCCTNDVILGSSVKDYGYGQYLLVGFVAHNENIDDSFKVNQDSCNRGMLITINLQLVKGKIAYNNIQNESSINRYNNSYQKLSSNGIPELNTVLEYGDALYGNATPQLNKKNGIIYFQDSSVAYKFIVPGRVDRMTLKKQDDSLVLRYTIASTLYLQKGHKLASRNAQKGTVSEIVPSSEMPYDENGIVPDILMSSISLLSRQTFNMYHEGILTNIYNLLPYDEKTGEKRFFTVNSFSKIDLKYIKDNFTKTLKEKYPKYSEEKINDIIGSNSVLYNPDTGNPLKSKVFMCPIYKTRLVQISDDKISASHKCKINKEGQPQGGGKQKGGAHRFGEMDFDLLGTYGASNLIYELSKDPIEIRTKWYTCMNCNNSATKIKFGTDEYLTCINCENINVVPDLQLQTTTQITKILQEMLAFRGIVVKIKNKENKTIYPSSLKKK